MAATLVLSGVCLFALLIGDICCVPVQKGNDPAAYDDSYRHAAPSYDPQPGPRSGPGYGPQLAPVTAPSLAPVTAPSLALVTALVSAPSLAKVWPPRWLPSLVLVTAPSLVRVLAPSLAPSLVRVLALVSAPSLALVSAPSLALVTALVLAPSLAKSGHYPLGSVSEGGSSPYYYPEMKPGYDQPSDWYVEPAWPGPMGKAPLAPAGVGSEYIRPPIPQPAYQGGELTHYEDSAEHGFYERESDEQGQFPHPPHIFASPKMVSSSMPHPLPPHPLLPQWGFYPYYYDYRFITGQYPPGTYTHASANFEHGRDAWQDVHYRQEGIPFEPVAESGASTSSVASLPGKAPVVYTGH
ncbi:hypothetical protein D4764_09G0006620 [Takifugu flavidus]|uniref:Uncharacterized protein n=1 Tax=Takifugu flavidus TaxID=433684 RepID=A0A5C6ML68_9TELE|nr:hypothetical protein D4764_09G0006620 [Takifugu flavidus]